MLEGYIEKQREWSFETFGNGTRTNGVVGHISKELDEIRQDPHDLMEWVDVIILALDGAWRSGHSPEEIVEALQEKQAINFARKWPEIQNDDVPIEHIRD